MCRDAYEPEFRVALGGGTPPTLPPGTFGGKVFKRFGLGVDLWQSDPYGGRLMWRALSLWWHRRRQFGRCACGSTPALPPVRAKNTRSGPGSSAERKASATRLLYVRAEARTLQNGFDGTVEAVPYRVWVVLGR